MSKSYNFSNNVLVHFTLQETDPRFDIVKKTYTEMHKYQTVDSVRARVRTGSVCTGACQCYVC